jgi:hypothetical protein
MLKTSLFQISFIAAGITEAAKSLDKQQNSSTSFKGRIRGGVVLFRFKTAPALTKQQPA